MKKFTLLFAMLIGIFSSAWATEINLTPSSGSYGATTGWKNTWTISASGLKFTASANNMNASQTSNYLDWRSGSAQSSTYTISVGNGCIINGYTITAYALNGNQTLTAGDVSKTITSSSDDFTVTGLSASSTSFTLSGSNTGLAITAITVSITEPTSEQLAAYNTVHGWVTTIQSAQGLVTDAANYISNAKSSQEGSYGALLDGEYTTYFHGAYGSEGPNEDQYLQATLSKPVDALYFYFKKRSQNNNNRPTSITISGSNDGSTFTDITTINSGLPTDASVIDYASSKINLGASYKYIRFTVTDTNNHAQNSSGHVFFTFSEFYVLPSDTDIDAVMNLRAELAETDAVYYTAQNVSDVNVANEALLSTMVNVAYELYESDGTTLVSRVEVEQLKNSEINVPSSLNSNPYYDYVIEGTIGTQDCTIKVTRTLKAGIVYPISNLSNYKAYTLTTERGSLGSNGTQMVSTYTTSYTASNFAIINYENNYYLYSVADSKFVGNPVTIGGVANQPALTNDLSQVSPLTFALTTAPLYFMGMGSNGVNVSNYATGIVVNSWTTRDAGNQYIIEEAADFDPTAALAALQNYFHPTANMRITNAGWATFWAPFAVEIPAGVKAYTGEMKQGWIRMNEQTKGYIPANTGVVLELVEGEPFETELSPMSPQPNEAAVESCYTGNESGAIMDVAVGNYLLQIQNDVVGWYKVEGEGFKLAPNRCYLIVPEPNQARPFIGFEPVDDATGINSIATEAKTKADGKYMVKGQIVVVKAGKAYNMSGAEIK